MTPKRPLRTPTDPPRPTLLGPRLDSPEDLIVGALTTVAATPTMGTPDQLSAAAVMGMIATPVIEIAPAAGGGECGVYKLWVQDERLTSPDLNDSFQRTVDANTPQCVAGYSETLAQMRQTTAPYPNSAESQATTLAGELERLRFQIAALVGKAHWYDPVDGGAAKGTAKDFGTAHIQLHEIPDPQTPAADELRLFAKDDGGGNTILAYKTPNGSVISLTGPQTLYGNSITQFLQIRPDPATPTARIAVKWDALSINGFVSPPAENTIDLTTTGVNALDAGVLAEGFLFIWAIYNPILNLFRTLASTSEWTPTMPAGYSARRLLGGVLITAGPVLAESRQLGDTVIYNKPLMVVGDGRNASATPVELGGKVPASMITEVFLGVHQHPAEATNGASLVVSSFPFLGAVTVENSTTLGPNVAPGGAHPAQTLGSIWLPLCDPNTARFYYATCMDPGIGPVGVDIYVLGYRVAWRSIVL